MENKSEDMLLGIVKCKISSAAKMWYLLGFLKSGLITPQMIRSCAEKDPEFKQAINFQQEDVGSREYLTWLIVSEAFLIDFSVC